jgi:phosphoribosylaminoimidazole (AIR) synthetase
MKAIRYYDANGFLVGYADENYCFTRTNDENGNMIAYTNSKGETLKGF